MTKTADLPRWDDKPYHSLNYYLKKTFGQKVYKLSLHGKMTCPNRDGKLDTRGCIFCSSGGSGEFSASPRITVHQQIEQAKKQIAAKHQGQLYIAYFQAFTNTYAPVERLRQLFTEALAHPDIIALSIATRPDCLPAEVLDLLSELNAIKPVWIELGLQTIHEKTAAYIRRGYPLAIFDQAVKELQQRNIMTIVHLILGLPGETKADVIASVRHLNDLPVQGVKLQLLHILSGTDLAADYEQGLFTALSQDEYTDWLISAIEHLAPEKVIHRISGDGPRDILLAPLWSGHKKQVLNGIHKEFKNRNAYQGKCSKSIHNFDMATS